MAGLRVLIVSAQMGGGHHAAGRATEEAVRRVWPDSDVHWVDVLDTAGRAVGPALRRLYVSNIQQTPVLYRFFYASLWRHRWFARASKRVVGVWFGRVLRTVLERLQPDLIVSTYPMASAGLAWLRRRGALAPPTVALVSDFAPHPFWVYRDLDLNLVPHRAAVALAQAAEPGARVQVCAPPVVSAFGPGNPLDPRQGFGLRPRGLIALLSCGSYGFGAVNEAAEALAEAGDDVQAVVVCGRNARLQQRLTTLGEPPERLHPLGWTDDMPALTRASDVVVTNAGGVTALEALATGRRLVMYRPIAAHGEANAALLTAVGLAETYRTPAQLSAAVATMTRAPSPPANPDPDTVTLGEALRALVGTAPGAPVGTAPGAPVDRSA